MVIGLWGADTRPHSWSEDEWHHCCGGELPNDRKVTFCLKIPLLGFHPPGTAVHESDDVLARLFTETLISSEDWRQVSITCSMGYNRKNEDGFYIRCGVSTGIYYVKRASSTTVFSMTALHTHTHTHTHLCLYLGLPGGTRGKESACQFRRCKKLRRSGFDSWVGKSP